MVHAIPDPPRIWWATEGGDGAVSWLIHVMLGIGWLASGGRFTPRLVKLSSHPDVHRWLNMGLQSLIGWPESFFPVLEQIRRQSRFHSGEVEIAGNIKFLVDWLEERAPIGIAEHLQRVLAEYATGHH